MTDRSPSATTRRRFLLGAGAAAAAVVAGGMVVIGESGDDPSAAASEPSAAGGAPPTSALGASTEMGVVELRSGDVERLRRFYVRGVGLDVVDRGSGSVTLGSDGRPLLRITAFDGPGDDDRQAGLYHAAFLYPTAGALAHALLRTAQAAPSAFAGSADHRVSQAFYFQDPEGNGVELYLDRPRGAWEWSDGQVRMGSEALDPNAFVAEHATGDDPGGAGIRMGHVHLRVGDLGAAEAFYGRALGFAVTSRSDGALFLAAGGYHHHVATNVWSSAGAATRPRGRGLAALTVRVDAGGELDRLVARLDAAGLRHRRTGRTVSVDDPWGTTVRITAAA